MNRITGIFSSALNRHGTLFIILTDLLIQFVVIGKYLDNSIISPYAPTAADAADYAIRAETWQNNGFSKAFSDAYRMPGYPFIIYLMRLIVPSAPYLGVRFFQMFAVAISVGLMKIMLEKYISTKMAIFGGLLYALLPVWHFVPVLLAESLTSVVVVGLLFLVARISKSGFTSRTLVSLSILVAIGAYLKPNNLLLIVPTLIYLGYMLETRIRRSLLIVGITIVLLISPWVFFANSVQKGFVGLTTNAGGNFYTGTGMVLSYDDSVLAKSAIKWKVDPNNNPTDIVVFSPNQTLLEQNTKLLEKSLNIWKKRPFRELGFSIDKIFIAFGAKANSLVDHIFGLISLLTIAAAVVLVRIRRFQAFGLSTLSVVLILALQAAVFQADRRFIVPTLFPFSVVCIGIASGELRKFKSGFVFGLQGGNDLD